MSTPVSLKERSFFALPTPKYSALLKDDFLQKKFETLSFKGTTTNNGSIQYKSTTEYKYDEKQAEKKDDFKLKDELKFGFALRSYYTQLRIDRSGNIRLHLDLGNVKLYKEQNLYTQLRFTDKFDKLWLRLGTNLYSGKCQAHHRLERTYDGELQFSYKNVLRYPSFVLGFATIFSLTNQRLNKYDAVFQYTHNQFELGLQHTTPRNDKVESEAFKAQQLGRLTAGLNYRHDEKTNLAVQVRRTFSKVKDVTVNVGVSHQLNNQTNLKAKINQDLKLTSSLKYKIDNQLQFTGSAQLPLKRQGGPLAHNQLIPLPVGYQIDFNI